MIIEFYGLAIIVIILALVHFGFELWFDHQKRRHFFKPKAKRVPNVFYAMPLLKLTWNWTDDPTVPFRSYSLIVTIGWFQWIATVNWNTIKERPWDESRYWDGRADELMRARADRQEQEQRMREAEEKRVRKISGRAMKRISWTAPERGT